ncbi:MULTISPECIES: IclR family transcriptional regulator [Rhizobiaceae]|uniref:DNA-binding IclR family transcriptional regulator n=1 Tax=Aliirhizobium cellulosilyticum TaxID=393664 RepID=A0A7W6Y3Q2_9HYPH|nr:MULTISPECIES: helix-turn-helix domain-containing protein [Rhizobium/Agrobacterium group]MBB4350591.1 DNA-binding IclR family transcriptional regulator [Rhizobium cellulosilyticum]MBB4413786.1 DNA-binding IclR family transcriptional regulator [Rhizobium cellulosilyticum]MBB4448401.1 DNA-binding IclR family transcriptional regulator [Rhizobium cellulosilyticum]MBO0143481.1 helix-turn-helix domain-containing protein [Agrobacterium sp. Ap1]
MTLDSAENHENAPPAGVLDRGLLILSLFTMERSQMHLREISEISGLDKATTLRALKSLSNWGFLERHADGSYSPGPMNMRLAAIFKATSNLVNRIAEPLNRISDQVNQVTAFYIRTESNRLCLVRSRMNRNHSYFVDVGASVSLSHGGSAARVLLAYSEPDNQLYRTVREDGFAISRGERLRHYASISIPLFEADGIFLGAVTINALSVDVTDEDFKRFADIARTEVQRSGFVIRLK